MDWNWKTIKTTAGGKRAGWAFYLSGNWKVIEMMRLVERNDEGRRFRECSPPFQ